LLVLVTISLINTSWQLLRAWLPKFLIEGRGYLESDALNFNALFYVATDIGMPRRGRGHTLAASAFALRASSADHSLLRLRPC